MSQRSEFLPSGGYRAAEGQMIHYEHAERWDGQTRLVVATHGHGSGTAPGCLATQQNHAFYGRAISALVRTGRYIVIAPDAGAGGGPSPWSNPDSVQAVADAVTWARARGARPGKYGILGYSMGGLLAANYLKRHPTEVAAMWTYAPAIDLDYVYSTAGHTPVANNATWTTEVNVAFGSYAATAGYRVWDEPASYRGLGVPWKLAHATDDSVIPYSISTSFVAAVNDPNVTLRTPTFTGNHTGQFQNIGDAEIVAHFDSGSW